MHLNANPHANNHLEGKKRICLAEDKAGGIIESMNSVSVEGCTIEKPFWSSNENTVMITQKFLNRLLQYSCM